MTTRCPLLTLVLALVLLVGVALVPLPAAAQGESQMTWAVHISLAPTWFDPAEHTGIITIMKVLYAVHDALVKPMPGNPMAPSLAESWSTSRDGLTYEFVLRKGVIFHNGDPMTAEDVKFSFDRYRGAAAKLLKDKVASVEIVDPQRVRFRLKEAWPDFMSFYATPATGAACCLPTGCCRAGENPSMNESQKIREAEYFLAQMDRERENAENFGHNLSAFLSSARSVLQYALEEAKPKPGGLA
jgi:ABC-type transport system substrate-binding protein